MAIIKIRKKDNYTILNNKSLTDARLSWKARGLWAYLMSLPADWEVSVNDLVKRGPDGRDSVYGILKELKSYGYIEHRYQRHNGQIYKGEYLVFEEPQPHPDFPDAENTGLEKPIQLITNITKETNNKETAAGEYSSYRNLKKQNAAADVYKTEDRGLKTESGIQRTEDKRPRAELLQAEDCLLGDKLTPRQYVLVNARIGYLAKTQGLDRQRLIEEVTHVLLNPECFSGCGNDFIKKLNTVAKQIRQKKWSTPPSLLAAAEDIKEIEKQEKNAAAVEISNLAGELKAAKDLLESAQSKNQIANIEYFQKEIRKITTKLQALSSATSAINGRADEQRNTVQNCANATQKERQQEQGSQYLPKESQGTRTSALQPVRDFLKNVIAKKQGTDNWRQPCAAHC